MGVEKIVIEDIRHLLVTAVEVLHLQVLGCIFAGTTDGSEEKADHHADRDDDGGDFGQEQAVLQEVVQHVKTPVEISSAYQLPASDLKSYANRAPSPEDDGAAGSPAP